MDLRNNGASARDAMVTNRTVLSPVLSSLAMCCLTGLHTNPSLRTTAAYAVNWEGWTSKDLVYKNGKYSSYCKLYVGCVENSTI